jgi:hypothetical protein
MPSPRSRRSLPVDHPSKARDVELVAPRRPPSRDGHRLRPPDARPRSSACCGLVSAARPVGVRLAARARSSSYSLPCRAGRPLARPRRLSLADGTLIGPGNYPGRTANRFAGAARAARYCRAASQPATSTVSASCSSPTCRLTLHLHARGGEGEEGRANRDLLIGT